MGIFSKIFGKKTAQEGSVVGMKDFMELVSVYLQAAAATRLGITNLAQMPALRKFKALFHVKTVNNKPGVGEKLAAKKMLKDTYGTSDSFFDEIDQSIKKNCKKPQDLQTFALQFQAFSQDLLMLVGNLMKFKLRVPSIFKKAIYSMTQKTVTDIFTKNDFSDAGVLKTVAGIRKYNQRLGFSQQWTTDFVYQLVMLAKKEPKLADDETTETTKK